MIINVHNTEELILGLLALCSELPKPKELNEMFMDDYNIKKNTLSKSVSLMKKAGEVSARKGFDGIRVKSPEGLVRLGMLSEDLYLHYMVISNGHKIKSGRDKRELAKRNRDSTLFMYRCGAYVDNLRLNYKVNTLSTVDDGSEDSPRYEFEKYFEQNGVPASVAELTKALPLDAKFFYTSRIIKDILNESGTKRIMLSKANGILCAGGNVYPSYFVQEGTAAYSKTHEDQVRFLAKDIHRNAYGDENERRFSAIHPNGHAIYIVENIRAIPELIQKKKRKYMTPGAVYGDYYILPCDNRGKFVINTLSTPDWETKVLDTLFYDDELTLDKLSDGEIEGVPSWEFMTCNFRKIDYILRSGSRHIKLICYPWQKELLESLLPKRQIDFMIMNDKEQKEFADAVFKKGETDE
jgi:hypothetical protein